MVSQNKTVIITGGASGMGEGVARDMIQQGWNVAIADLDSAKGEALAKELGENARFFETDVASFESQAQLFKNVWDLWGRLDVMIPNAGILDRDSAYILGYRDSDQPPPAPNTLCTEVCFFGVIYSCRLAVFYMRKNKTPGGKIIITASSSSLYYHPNFPEYTGAKYAVLGFVRSVADVFKLKDNVTINCILPQMVKTALAPQAMIDAFTPEQMTPISTIVRAYNLFLKDDTGVTGQAVEASVDKIISAPMSPYLNGALSERGTYVFEPLFKAAHGEYSELKKAVYK